MIFKKLKDLIIKNSAKNPFSPSGKTDFIDEENNRKLFKPVEVLGYLNPFIELMVEHKGETIMKEPLTFTINTRLKDYNLLIGLPDGSNSPIVTLKIGNMPPVKFPLILKSMDEQQFLQKERG